ncbi:TPA: hypothetical protein ACTYW0_004556 [Enterobacter asburiae]
MDESRKAFEQWYLLNWGHTEDNHETLFEIGPGDDSYYRLGVRLAYEPWLASRAAIEIEPISQYQAVNAIPNASTSIIDAVKIGYLLCAEAAGIKVKE